MRKKNTDAVVWPGSVPDTVSAVLQGRMLAAEAMALTYGLEPPELKVFGSLLLNLPPLISRDMVADVLGLKISPKTLANHDCAGTGPRLRFQVAGRIVYPAAFFLEWVEKQNLIPLVAKAV